MTLQRQGSYDFAAQAEILRGSPILNAPTLLAAAGALNPSAAGMFLITQGSAQADTLAAPVVGTDDFKVILLMSTTAFAHTLTATGLLKTGSTNVNLATFAAFAGANVQLMAYQGLWYVIASTGVTFT